MDSDFAQSWVMQHDVCRCCLAGRGVWDLTFSYTNDGVSEILSEILMENLGISLTHLHGKGSSSMVCESCVDSLQNARKFRQQVLQAEEKFLQYYSKMDTFNGDIPLYDEDVSVSIKRDIDDFENATNVDIDCPTELVKEENNEKGNTKTINIGIKEENVNSCSDDDEINIDTQESNKSLDCNRPAKPISERKKMTQTFQTVLSHTTACAFRHHRSWFRCLYCPQEAADMPSLRLHAQKHNDIAYELKKITCYPKSLQIDISKFKCRICDVTLLNIEHMCEHFLKQHDKVVFKEFLADFKVDKSPFSCHLCDKQFHVFRTLTVHLNEHYANCICEECGKSFINSKRLKVHKRTHNLGEFPCKKCQKILSSRTAFVNHMETHSERVLKCQICQLPMKHYNDRVKHMSIVHNISHTFKCSFCPKEYNIKHNLTTHIRQTHGSRNKKCSQCNMAFVSNHGLEKHMAKHSGLKPFSCHVCPKAYARSYTLKEHMKGHK